MRNALAKLLTVFILGIVAVALHGGTAQAYTQNRLMDDQVFDNVNSMNEAQIQQFLVSRGSTCLANYYSEDANWNGSSWSYGGSVSAAHTIYHAAQMWGINPQVIIATLQKEESLIVGSDCAGWRYNSAMGYGCPDSGGCDARYAGFSRQVLWGSFQLKFNKERAIGNVNWGDNGNLTYVGYMTAGTYKRCASCSAAYYNGHATIDGQDVYMENGTTASLYSYTPHLGQSFPGIFEGWFGSTFGGNPYTWQLVGQRVIKYGGNQDVDISQGVTAGERLVFYIQARNTGPATWSNSGANPVRIGTSHDNDRTSVFCEVSWIACGRPVAMVESSVAPGEVGTFQFAVQAPATPGTYSEYFNPLIEGVSWMNDIGLYFNIKVNSLNLAYTTISDTVPTQLSAGATGSGVITLRNDSNVTWYNTVKYPIRIGSSGPPDRQSSFVDPSWIGATRLANQNEFMVAPGSQATFNVTLKAPANSGTYTEALAPVAEGIKWSDQTFNHSVGVKQGYDATLDSSSTSNVTLGGADRQLITLKYLNTGLQTWTNTGPNPIRIATSASDDRTSGFCDIATWIACHRPTTLLEGSVAPGEIGTFQFYLEGRPYHNSNPYTETFRPIKEGVVRFGPNTQVRVNYTRQAYGWQLTDQYAVVSSGNRTPVDMTTMTPGQTILIGFKARNTGTATWYNTGDFPVRVATSRPVDRASAFCDNATWIACHRPVKLLEGSVAPSAVGTFEFTFKAPATAGKYNEYFIPVIEGYTYLNDIGLYYTTTVQ